MNRICLAGVVIAFVTLPAVAQNAPPKIVIKVLNHQSKPVAGSIKMGDRTVGLTKGDGTLALAHKCELGQMFKAEPMDAAKYYNSDEQVCSAEVALTVFPRPQLALTTDPLTPFRIVVAPSSPQPSQIYAGLFGSIQDRTEAVKNDGRERCKLTLSKSVKVGYLSSEAPAWALVAASAPAASKLAEPETFFFQGTCANSMAEIADVKMRAQADFKKSANDYMTINSERIDNSAIATIKRANPSAPTLIKG